MGDNANLTTFALAAGLTGVCMFMGYNIFSFVSTLGESSGKKKSDTFPVFKRPATTNAASSSSSTTSASVVKEEGDGGDVECAGF